MSLRNLCAISYARPSQSDRCAFRIVAEGYCCMAHAAHWDWTFEHSQSHHWDPPSEAHADNLAPTAQLPQADSVASVLKTLWHNADLMTGVTSSAHASNSASGNAAPPTLTVANSAITVD